MENALRSSLADSREASPARALTQLYTPVSKGGQSLLVYISSILAASTPRYRAPVIKSKLIKGQNASTNHEHVISLALITESLPLAYITFI